MGLPKSQQVQSVEQNQILAHMHLVHQEVRKMMRRGIVQYEYDELVQIGTIGLMEAVYRFDELRRQSFSMYARIRIQGSIIDEIRKRDWVPRSVRQRSNNLKEGVEYLKEKLQRTPTRKELCAHLNIKERKFSSYRFHSEIAPLVSLEAGEFPIIDQVPSTDSDAQEALMNKEAIQEMMQLIDDLSPQDKEIIRQYYFEDKNMKSIAQCFNVTESRICQIHQKIKKQFARKLRAFK
jgi:RNA polymerase sigma factor for flagellar operon FliA